MQNSQENSVKKQNSRPKRRKHLNKFVLIATLVVSSCATEEEIARRKALARVVEEMKSQQKITKNLLLKSMRIEQSLGTVSGKIEENQYKEGLNLEQNVQNLTSEIEKIKNLQQNNAKQILEQKNQLKALEGVINEQKTYLDKVLKEIKKVSRVQISRTISLKSALIDYQDKKYPRAKQKFEKILSAPKKYKLSKKDTPRVLHNLGIIYFIEKDYKNAQSLFSQLFSEYEKSGLNSSGLYHLGLCFKEQNNQELMKQTFTLLKEKFPKSRYTKKAKKFLE